MKKIRAIAARVTLVIALLFGTVPALADVMRAEDGYGTTVTLMNTECTNKAALAQLQSLNGMLAAAGRPTITVDGLHASNVVHQGKQHDGCWMLSNETVAVLADTPEGVQLMGVPASEFRKIEGI